MENTAALKEEIEQLKEDLFLAYSDLDKARTENVALKNFILDLYESCEALEESEMALGTVLENLKKNIRMFSKDHNIRI